ncbi:MAG: preprotein translocase subunit SecG [Brockia lithotrophica]|nr:preprotein translocase subunit SecG [Brockia lithotrophica]
MVKTALEVLLVLVSLALIATILLQPGRSAGLSDAITGGAEHLFGRQKARGLEGTLARATRWLAVAFMVLAFVLAYFLR